VTLIGIEGAAGTGKTYRLMELVADSLEASPLAEGQRFLALTFMHGSRRRLSERLRAVTGLNSRFDCLTFDGFAHRLRRRWSSLARSLSIPSELDFSGQCEAASLLLERDEVRAWVTAAYPALIVDEAQDLDSVRSRMLMALSRSLRLLVAADDFQCLNTAILPAPAVTWLRGACTTEVLTVPRRTSQSELLAAAAMIRAGTAPRSGGQFQLLGSKGDGMTAAHLTRTLALGGTRDIAILTPSTKSGWAPKIAGMIENKSYGKFGPFAVRWERSDSEEASIALGAMQLSEQNGFDETLGALESLPDCAPVRAIIRWIYRQRDAHGVTNFSRLDILATLERHYQYSRRFSQRNQIGYAAMTIHQAKNQEFSGVIVLWPYAVGGNDDAKRRLLYNAVTRAKRWCSVIVQNDKLLTSVPFR
jgi:hypothetical protein